MVYSSVREVRKMPGGDGTGPGGMGPMTGRAAGFCAGYPVPGFMNPIGGRLGLGLGRGRGMGRGMGRRPFNGYQSPGYGAYGGYGMPYGQSGYGMPYMGGYGAPYGQSGYGMPYGYRPY
jgi:hypothetical protein